MKSQEYLEEFLSAGIAEDTQPFLSYHTERMEYIFGLQYLNRERQQIVVPSSFSMEATEEERFYEYESVIQAMCNYIKKDFGHGK